MHLTQSIEKCLNEFYKNKKLHIDIPECFQGIVKIKSVVISSNSDTETIRFIIEDADIKAIHGYLYDRHKQAYYVYTHDDGKCQGLMLNALNNQITVVE